MNYQAPGAAPINRRKDTGALDIIPPNNHFVRFRLLNYSYKWTHSVAGNYQVIPQIFDRPNYTWTASPTLVNELLISASRDQVYINIERTDGLFNRAGYGINYPYLFPTGKNIPEKIRTITLNGPFNELSGLPYPSSSAGPIYDISDTIIKVKGDHTLKAGFLFERAGQNDYDQINVHGVRGGTNNQNGRFVLGHNTRWYGSLGCQCGNRAVRHVRRARNARIHPLSRIYV